MRASHDLFGDRPDDDLARDSAEAPPLEPLGLGPLVCEPSPRPVLGVVDVEDEDERRNPYWRDPNGRWTFPPEPIEPAELSPVDHTKFCGMTIQPNDELYAKQRYNRDWWGK